MLDYGILFQFLSFHLIFSRPWKSRKHRASCFHELKCNVKAQTFEGWNEGGAVLWTLTWHLPIIHRRPYSCGSRASFHIELLWNNCHKIYERPHFRRKLLSILLWPIPTLALITSRWDIYCLVSHTRMYARWAQGISVILYLQHLKQCLVTSRHLISLLN